MRHFNMVQWADHVRGVASDDNALVMEEHLAAGCNL